MELTAGVRRVLLIAALAGVALLGLGVCLAQAQTNPTTPTTPQHVICDSGCGSPPASADGTAFVAGTSNVSLIGAAFNDALADLTAGTYAAPRLTVQRGLHVNLRDTAGNPSGVPGNGLEVATTGFNVLSVGQANFPWYTIVYDGLNSLAISAAGAAKVEATQATGTNLHMVCDSGCGSAAATPDNSAFAFGTTSTAPIAFVVDDVATNSVTENSYGAARMSGSRILYTDVSKSGSNTNSFKVDFGGAGQPVTGTFWQATQPVSGTFWQATQPVSGTFWPTAATAPLVARLSNGLGFLTPTTPSDTQPVSASVLPLPSGAAKESGNLATIAAALTALPSAQVNALCGGWPCRAFGPSGYVGTNTLAVAYDPKAPPVPTTLIGPTLNQASQGNETGPVVRPVSSQRAGTAVTLSAACATITTVCPAGSFATITIDGYSGGGFQVLAGTLAATYVFDFSLDGTNWQSATAWDVTASTAVQFSSLPVTNPNAQTTFSFILSAGVRIIRFRLSSYTSGSAQVQGFAGNNFDSFAASVCAQLEGQSAAAGTDLICRTGGTDQAGLARMIRLSNTLPTGAEYGLITRDAVLGQASLITFQASQVSGVANATTTRTTTTGLDRCRMLDLLINITGGGVATGTLQLYLQDSADGGTTWDDLVSSNTFTFGAAVVTQRFWVLPQSMITANFGTIATSTVTAINQGSVQAVDTLAAGAAAQRPFGDRLRVREKVSGVAGTPTGVTYTITGVCK